MTVNKGLGKGLGALISLFDEDLENVPSQNVPRGTISQKANDTGVVEIDVNLIDNNKSQPRKDFDPNAMAELEQSISTHGVIQPIILNRMGSRYMIVAGERRWRASKNVGLKTIPAIVRDYTTKQIAEIALVENLMRSDLNEMEIAVGIKKLMDTHNMTQENVSKVLGMSRSGIANSLRFLNLPKEVQNLLAQKKISAGHAKCLCAVDDDVRCVALANKCASGMSVRQLEVAVNDMDDLKHLKPPVVKKYHSLELKEFADLLQHVLAQKVEIEGDDKQGKIIIKYSSRGELESVRLKLLKGLL